MDITSTATLGKSSDIQEAESLFSSLRQANGPMARASPLANQEHEVYHFRNCNFSSSLELSMGTRILNSAVFVLAIGCTTFLPGRLLAQGEGSTAVQLQPAATEEEATAD